MRGHILVMANGNSIFTYQYIKKMCSENYEIALLDFAHSVERQKHYEYYSRQHIMILHYSQGANSFINCLITALTIKALGVFDICHVMFVRDAACQIVELCRDSFRQIVINFWGSDFYRASRDQQDIQKNLLDMSDVIILPVATMEKPFAERWPDLKERMETVEFESIIYTKLKSGDIDQKEPVQEDFLRKTENKIIMVAGHSGDPGDQHEMIISAVDRCDASITSRIIIVFPMTYNRLSEEYEHKIRNRLKDASFESIVLTEFMTDDQVCMLRERTDVFIQAITTDAFSGAMEENLYSQSVILCGDWLNYPQLHEEANSVIWYSDENDLSDNITMVVNDIDEYKKKAVGNRACIERIKAKRKNVMNWSDFYTTLPSPDSASPKVRSASGDTEAWLKLAGKLQKADSRKKLYNDVMNEWLKKQIQSEAPIRSYIEENHIRNVLIYGGGTLGELIYKEIKDECDITVCDQCNEERPWYGGEIKTPDMLENSFFECIIITPIHVAAAIRKVLDKKRIRGNQVISVSEIVNRKAVSI